MQNGRDCSLRDLRSFRFRVERYPAPRTLGPVTPAENRRRFLRDNSVPVLFGDSWAGYFSYVRLDIAPWGRVSRQCHRCVTSRPGAGCPRSPGFGDLGGMLALRQSSESQSGNHPAIATRGDRRHMVLHPLRHTGGELGLGEGELCLQGQGSNVSRQQCQEARTPSGEYLHSPAADDA